MRLVDEFVKLDTFNFFIAPVDDEIAPGYSKVISSPMDLYTMRQKVSAGTYKSWDVFVNDFDRICSNAMTFNAKKSTVHKAASTFQRNGRKLLQTHELEVRKSLSLAYGRLLHGAFLEAGGSQRGDVKNAQNADNACDAAAQKSTLAAEEEERAERERARALSADEASSSFSDTQSELSGAEEVARSVAALQQLRNVGFFGAGGSSSGGDAGLASSVLIGRKRKKRSPGQEKALVMDEEDRKEWQKNPRRRAIEWRCRWLETRIADLQSQIMNYDLQQVALRASKGTNDDGADGEKGKEVAEKARPPTADAGPPPTAAGEAAGDAAEAKSTEEHASPMVPSTSRCMPVIRGPGKRRVRWRRRMQPDGAPKTAEERSAMARAHPVLSFWAAPYGGDDDQTKGDVEMVPPTANTDGGAPPLTTNTRRQADDDHDTHMSDDEEELMRLCDTVRAIQRGSVVAEARVRKALVEAKQKAAAFNRQQAAGFFLRGFGRLPPAGVSAFAGPGFGKAFPPPPPLTKRDRRGRRGTWRQAADAATGGDAASAAAAAAKAQLARVASCNVDTAADKRMAAAPKHALSRSMSVPGGDADRMAPLVTAPPPITQRRRSSADFDMNDVVMLAPPPSHKFAEGIETIRATDGGMGSGGGGGGGNVDSAAPIGLSPIKIPPVTAAAATKREDEALELPTDFDVAKVNVDDGYEDMCDEEYLLRNSPLEIRNREVGAVWVEKKALVGAGVKSEWITSGVGTVAAAEIPAPDGRANMGVSEASPVPRSDGDDGDDSPANEQKSNVTLKGCTDAEGDDESPRSVGSHHMKSPASLSSLWDNSDSGAVAVAAATT